MVAVPRYYVATDGTPFRAPAGATNALAAGCGPCLVIMGGRLGSTITDQLLQHYGLDSAPTPAVTD
jgi:hypothetical protein